MINLLPPMLAEEVGVIEAERLINDDNYALDQKLDGHRVLVHTQDGEIVAGTRDGRAYTRSIPKILAAFPKGDMSGLWVFDGEYIQQSSTYWLFDVLHIPGHVTPDDPYEKRRHWLDAAYTTMFNPDGPVRLVATALGSAEKMNRVSDIALVNGEGFMLKRLDGKYRLGLRAREILKYKFTTTADCVVLQTGIDGKSNCELGVFRDGELTVVGRCSTLGKFRVQPGDVVEVTYLYVGANGRLYQPRLLHNRPDRDPASCLWDQLKHVSHDVVP